VILVQLNEKFGELASDERIRKTAAALKENGFEVEVVENKEEAKRKVLEMIPEGSEVFTMSSQTLEQAGLSDAINNSGKYNSVRNKLFTMDRNTQAREMARLGAAPDWVVSSVHALTEDGHLIIASNTGSQLSAEAYAGGRVIFVVGAQKIVKDNQEGIKRIYEYCLPLEDERARKAYGMGSNVSKILIINKEIFPQRITVFLVKEKLGF
jgi:hypothetical protein